MKYEDIEGVEHCEVIDVPVQNNFKVHTYIATKDTPSNRIQQCICCACDVHDTPLAICLANNNYCKTGNFGESE